MIKVLGLILNREKQSDSSIAWLMFHKIYCMYSDINKKEEINAAMLFKSMSEHEEYKKFNKELKLT